MPKTDAAVALHGVATAMDGPIPLVVGEASRAVANEVELIAYGGNQFDLAEASTPLERAVALDRTRDISER